MAQPRIKHPQDLFPDALMTTPLQLDAPPRTLVRARLWSRLSFGMVFVGMCVFIVIGEISERMNSYGSIFTHAFWREVVYAGWYVAGTLLAGAGIVYAWARLSVGSVALPETEQVWNMYALDRGLGDAPIDMSAVRNIDMFTDGDERHFSPQLGGHLGAGRVPVTVGATRWVEIDSDGDKTSFEAAYAATRLPDDITDLYAGCSVTRYLFGFHFDIDLPGGESRRFESLKFDNACNVHTAETPDDIRWWKLFDPKMIDGHVHTHNIQWIQQGPWLVVVDTASSLNKVHAERMDSLVDGLLWLVDQYRSATNDVLTAKSEKILMHHRATLSARPVRATS